MFLYLLFMDAANVSTPARAALRWHCGLGLGGMVGSALMVAFHVFFKLLGLYNFLIFNFIKILRGCVGIKLYLTFH
jgi:hypothetical protein